MPIVTCLFLNSCEEQWVVELKDVNNSTIFCFRRAGIFSSSPGLQFYEISVDVVDRNSHIVESEWETHNIASREINYKINCITYGVAPNGWYESIKAKKLRYGLIYAINDHVFFVRSSFNRYYTSNQPNFK